MGVYYLITSLSYFAICAVSFYAYFLWKKEKATDKISRRFGMFGSLFMLPAIMNFLWAFSILEPTGQDAMFINGSFYVIASVLSLITIHDLTGNRNLLYLLALFGVTIFSLAYSFSNFFVSLLVTSGLLFLIISLDVLIVKRYHIQFAGLIGVVYALTILFFSALLYLGVSYTSLWWFLPNAMLALFIFMLHLDKVYYSLLSPGLLLEQKPHVRKVFFGLNFIRYTLYIASVVSFTLVATVAIHELGHAVTAYYYGCEHAAIVFDLKEPPHTELRCPAAVTPILVITLTGVLFVLAASMIFYLTEGQFTTRLAHLMLGIGILIAYNDVLGLGLSKNVATAIALAALLIIIDAVVRFSLFYINEHSKLAPALAPAPAPLAEPLKPVKIHVKTKGAIKAAKAKAKSAT